MANQKSTILYFEGKELVRDTRDIPPLLGDDPFGFTLTVQQRVAGNYPVDRIVINQELGRITLTDCYLRRVIPGVEEDIVTFYFRQARKEPTRYE